MSLRAIIPGRPIAFARTATTAAGVRVNPTRYRRWKADAAQLLAVAGRYRRMHGEVTVALTVHRNGLAVTVEAVDKPLLRPEGIIGDLDNYTKAVLDALVDAGILGDDRQVVALEVVFDPTPLPADLGER